MFGFGRRNSRDRPLPAITDDVLGEIAYDRARDAWVTTIGPEEVAIEFASGPPAEEMLEYGRRLVRGFDALAQRVSDFLEAEARAYETASPHDLQPSPAAIYRQLRIETVSIFDGRRGMIWFAGGPDDMLFRCDLIDGDPRELGCDT